MGKRFSKIFIVEAGHDFSRAEDYADSIIILTDGTERFSEVNQKLRSSLSDFDPSTDAVIPVGRSVSCLITGKILEELVRTKGCLLPILYGVFNNQDYEFQEAR